MLARSTFLFSNKFSCYSLGDGRREKYNHIEAVREDAGSLVVAPQMVVMAFWLDTHQASACEMLMNRVDAKESLCFSVQRTQQI